MTAALIEDQALVDWDYKIDCEQKNCTRTAVVSAKGCGDRRHFLRCQICWQKDFNRIKELAGFLCNHCHRPILDPSTHLDEIWL